MVEPLRSTLTYRARYRGAALGSAVLPKVTAVMSRQR